MLEKNPDSEMAKRFSVYVENMDEIFHDADGMEFDEQN